LNIGDDTAKLKFQATIGQLDLNSNQTPDLYEALNTKFIIMPEAVALDKQFKKQSIKIYKYDPTTQIVTFEPVKYAGRYIFSYISGLVKFEETETFIAVSWKLHTRDGATPFYKLYVNGNLVVNQTLSTISSLVESQQDKTSYDSGQYDIDVYEE
jgi:hypothetical protein